MNNEETEQLYLLADTPPEEAYQNITDSNFFDIKPEEYKQYKNDLAPIADNQRRPATLNPAVTNYMREDTQKASIAKEDTGVLNYLSNYAKYTWREVTDKPSLDRQISELNNRIMDEPDFVTEADREYLADLNAERNRMEEENFGIDSTIEKIPSMALRGVRGIVESSWENLGIVGTSTAGGAAVGGLTPFGPVGVAAGAATGLSWGLAAAGVVDGVEMTRGEVYNTISNMTDDKGKPLEIAEDSKKRLSWGVGLIAGAADGVTSYFLGRNNSLVKELLKPKQMIKLVSNPAMRVTVENLGRMAQDGITAGTSSAVAEFATILGERLAQEGDERSVGSLWKIVNEFTAEDFERLGVASTAGAATGGAIAGLGEIATRRRRVNRYTRMNEEIQARIPEGKELFIFEDDTGKVSWELKDKPEADQARTAIEGEATPRETILPDDSTYLEKADKAVKAREIFEGMSNITTQTKMKTAFPSEMSNFKKTLFSTIGHKGEVYFTPEDLRNFSDTPEKGDLVRSIIDPEGRLPFLEDNEPISMSLEQVSEINDQFPEIGNHVRVEPDAPSAIEAERFIQKRTEAAFKSQEILKKYEGFSGLIPEEDITQIRNYVNELDEARKPLSEFDYLSQDTLPELSRNLLGDEQAQSFENSVLDARLNAAKEIREEIEGDFERETNRIFKGINEEQLKQEMKELAPKLEVLEEFDPKRVNTSFKKGLVARHKKKGYSPYAIDPRTLPDNLREAYMNDPVLKKRKVFVEGGINFSDVGDYFPSVGNATDILRILANTPTRKEVLKDRKRQSIFIKNEINQSFKPEKMQKIERAFDNLTKAHQKQLDFLWNKRPKETRKGVEFVAKRKLNVKQVKKQAELEINQSNVKGLNPRVFKVAENKYHNQSVEAYLKGDIDTAIRLKEKSILENEKAFYATKARQTVDSNRSFIKKLKNKSYVETLKKAKYYDAAVEVLDTYNLDPSMKGLGKQGAFYNFIDDVVSTGGEYIDIPEALTNPPESIDAATVEQFNTYSDVVRSIYHHARNKNKIQLGEKTSQEIAVLDKFKEDVENNLTKHPQYKPDRVSQTSVKDPTGIFESVKRLRRGFIAGQTNILNILTELDGEKPNGFFYNEGFAPIDQRRKAYRSRMKSLVDQRKQTQDAEGVISKYKNTLVNIPEFEDVPSLGYGKMRKTDLLTLSVYRGDPEGSRSIGVNFRDSKGNPISNEVIQQVLERELSVKDVKMAHDYLVKPYQGLRDDIAGLVERDTGIVPQMIEGITYNHKGVEIEGGYYPVSRRWDGIAPEPEGFSEINKQYNEGMLYRKGEDEFFARRRSSEMTNQGRRKERTGGEMPLDLDFENHVMFDEQFLHDIYFSDLGQVLLTKFKDKDVKRHIINTVGKEKYETLVDSYKDLMSKSSERVDTLYNTQSNIFNKPLRWAHNVHAVGVIGYKISSTLMQPLSLRNITLRYGPKMYYHLTSTIKDILLNPDKYQEFLNVASKIDPNLALEMDGIDNTVTKRLYDFAGKKRKIIEQSKKVDTLYGGARQFQEALNQGGFFLIREVDKSNRLISIIGITRGFMNGDIPGYPYSKISKMSPQQLEKTLKNVVSQGTQLSLTASAPEHKTWVEKKLPSISRYYTDVRATLNTNFSQYRKTSNSFREGNYKSSTAYYLQWALASGLARNWIDLVRGELKPKEELKKLKKEGIEDITLDMLKTAGSFLTAPVGETLESMVLVRDGMYLAESDYKRPLSTPALGVGTDLVNAVDGISDYLVSVIEGGKRDNLNKQESRALMSSLGYISNGLPVRGAQEMWDMLNSKEMKSGRKAIGKSISRLTDLIDEAINVYKDDPEAETLVNQLEDFRNNELPNTVQSPPLEEVIPENINENFKGILSNNQWDKYDPETTAFGIYQFTEERWEDLIENVPSLGLTEQGRTSKNPEEQERAFKWVTEDNTETLQAYGLEVNEESLLGSHIFGVDNYAEILQASDESNLSSVVGETIGQQPSFKRFKTVKEVKDYIKSQID